MHNEKEYTIERLSRIEGHGNINIKVKDGKIRQAEWNVVETPRFFEAMVVDKHFNDVPLIVSRICGICSIAHVTASIRATERAFSIEAGEETKIFRRILMNAETLQSHILHLCFLALPDFIGEGSIIPVISMDRSIVDKALRLKSLANKICEIIGGRETHPMTMIAGGFTKFPVKADLLQLKKELETSLIDLDDITKLFRNFKIPDFERKTEYVSLKGKDEYPWIGGDLMSSDGVIKSEDEYKKMTNEYMAPWSTAKLAKLSRDSFAVGALARVNNNFDLLHQKAKVICEMFNLKPICYNPFMNNIAQLAECYHVVYETVDLLKKALNMNLTMNIIKIMPKRGKGAGAIEAPRGILYHFNEYNNKGRIVHSDYIIPTSQNHANIYNDLKKLVEVFSGVGRKDSELELLCQMLVRSYDPCISCSVH